MEVAMKRSNFLTYSCAAIAALFLLCSCNRPYVHRVVWDKYPPRDKNAPVEMFVGRVARPHTIIAVLQSHYSSDQTDESKAQMLAQIKKLALRVGADAVMDVRMVPKRFEGMIMDDKVPFPAWKPGDYQAFAMRGTAIIYDDIPSSPSPESIPPAPGESEGGRYS